MTVQASYVRGQYLVALFASHVVAPVLALDREKGEHAVFRRQITRGCVAWMNGCDRYVHPQRSRNVPDPRAISSPRPHHSRALQARYSVPERIALFRQE